MENHNVNKRALYWKISWKSEKNKSNVKQSESNIYIVKKKEATDEIGAKIKYNVCRSTVNLSDVRETCMLKEDLVCLEEEEHWNDEVE